ncbi:hypothetical protein ACIBAI_03965 [Streptomyces sp. NPDC051041]|uniref:hypothetical protein n=1 Tax=Streptomyces sp. NPDC051041 TaxID=3365640 RepID=UPI003795D3A7
MRRTRSVVSIALTALVLAGCGGGGSPDAEDGGKGRSATPSAEASPGPKGPSVLLTVPSAYDPERGWQHTLDWMPENYSAQPLVAVGTRSDTVAYVDTAEDGYVVQVRDASTGTVRFTSRPWEPPAPLEGNGLLGHSVQLPSVATTVQDGREYVVLWAHGETGGDALSKGEQSVRLLVFPADASGSAVAPTREIDIPVEVLAPGREYLRVADFGTGLEVHWEAEDTAQKAVAVDVTNGTLDRCADACAESIGRIRTDRGWIVSDYSQDAVSMPGGWDIRDAAPPGAKYPEDAASNEFVGVTGGHLFTRWKAESGSVLHSLTALHDASTGELETSVVCDDPRGSEAVASPDGRFVAAGTVAFDLQQRSGFCLDAGDDRKASVYIWSIADGGTAYGTLDDTRRDNERTAEVDLSTGTPRLLPEGTRVPDLTLKDTGVFLTPHHTGGLLISALRTK